MSGGPTRSREGSILTSPQLQPLSRDQSWPLDNFRDLHVSGSEPRIFPGLVSRTQRRDSLNQRKVGVGEREREDRKSKRSSRSVTGFDGTGTVLDEEEEQESDGDMEEAGGMDE